MFIPCTYIGLSPNVGRNATGKASTDKSSVKVKKIDFNNRLSLSNTNEIDVLR